MSIKVSVWDKILKVIIAVASAIAGVVFRNFRSEYGNTPGKLCGARMPGVFVVMG